VRCDPHSQQSCLVLEISRWRMREITCGYNLCVSGQRHRSAATWRHGDNTQHCLPAIGTVRQMCVFVRVGMHVRAFNGHMRSRSIEASLRASDGGVALSGDATRGEVTRPGLQPLF
jgi:hypothetical protein